MSKHMGVDSGYLKLGSATYDFLLVTLGKHTGLCRTVSEIAADFCRKVQISPNPCVFNAPAKGVPLGILSRRWSSEKPGSCPTRRYKEFDDVCIDFRYKTTM